MDSLEIFIRLGSTFLLSFIFGLSRQYLHKPVGFGTFIFVSVGACALAITALNLSPENPLPLLSSIVTGIGFLGAGALIKTSGDRIHGFTNASTIWLFAVFGMLLGVGEYAIGMIIFLIVIVSLILDIILEERGVGSYQRRLFIYTNTVIDKDTLALELGLNVHRHQLLSMEIDKKNCHVCFAYLLQGSRLTINKIGQQLYKRDWVESYKIE
jgi:putative Mg2+ transporter-C (MgtC) family protein